MNVPEEKNLTWPEPIRKTWKSQLISGLVLLFAIIYWLYLVKLVLGIIGLK